MISYLVGESLSAYVQVCSLTWINFAGLSHSTAAYVKLERFLDLAVFEFAGFRIGQFFGCQYVSIPWFYSYWLEQFSRGVILRMGRSKLPKSVKHVKMFLAILS